MKRAIEKNRRHVWRLAGDAAAVGAVAVSTDGQTLATAGEDNLVPL